MIIAPPSTGEVLWEKLQETACALEASEQVRVRAGHCEAKVIYRHGPLGIAEDLEKKKMDKRVRKCEVVYASTQTRGGKRIHKVKFVFIYICIPV